MNRLDNLSADLQGLDTTKREITISLLKDFIWLEDQIADLRKYPRYIMNPNNPLQQKKLPAHDILKDYQAQKDDIATKILKSIDGEVSGESPLLEMLKKMK